MKLCVTSFMDGPKGNEIASERARGDLLTLFSSLLEGRVKEVGKDGAAVVSHRQRQ